MNTCITDYDIDKLANIIAKYYHQLGYNLDEYDKDNNIIVVDYSLLRIQERENMATNKETPFYASGFLMIPYTIFSSIKDKSSLSDESRVSS